MATHRLEGRVAIVTGASSGLGRAIALTFAKNGARVVCADLEPRGHKAQEAELPTHEVIKQDGGESIFVKTDVSATESIKALVGTTVDLFGRLDIMVNNAGIAAESYDPVPIHQTTDERWDATMAVNARGTYLGCKYAAIQMLKQDPLHDTDRGWIVNISSALAVNGLVGTPCYSASKGAVLSLTRAVAIDLAPHHIHCNAILPGFVRTPMISSMSGDPEGLKRLEEVQPFHRVGDPAEIANTAIFLCSDDANGISGVGLPVDGGLTVQLKI